MLQVTPNTESRTIDCTPTWEGLLPLLLTVYEQQSKKRGIHAQNAVTDIKTELRRMAQAADKWNEHVKEYECRDRRKFDETDGQD